MRNLIKTFGLSFVFISLYGCEFEQGAKIEGEGKVWHVQTLTFSGPLSTETSDTFTNYRLDTEFKHENGTTLKVPGYFAADGDAAETSADAGQVWQVKFVPPSPGTWTYKASFRIGENLAIKPSQIGQSAGYFDGSEGKFKIPTAELDVNSRDFRKQGRLSYANTRYLKFAGTGKYFIKTGAGSPENMLGYEDFDGTYDAGGTKFPALGENQLHAFTPHANDALATDPTWQNGHGRNLLGLINYLSDVGVNAQYLLSMNVEGDGQDVWPWVRHDTPYVFDVSKLAQWERVFSHMDQKGIVKDLLLAETENESWFEITDQTDPEFSDARKLYYREMVARFGHLQGLVWNLGEEHGVDGNNGNEAYRKATTAKQRLAFSKYISNLDSYDHPIVSHNWPDTETNTYGDKLGSPHFSGISLQAHHDYGEKIAAWTQKSTEAGRPWIITVDEPLGWEYGARPDSDVDDRSREIIDVLVPTLVSGGAGVDWYFGWQNNAPTSDLSNEDMRSRHTLWIKSTELRRWWESNVPFHDMQWQSDGATGALVHKTPETVPSGTIIRVSMTSDEKLQITQKSIPQNTQLELDPMNLPSP